MTQLRWTHGFSDTSLQDLEPATAVNKSGLYTEFRDKEDLFVACLRHYLESQEKRGLLTKEPLGWKNIEIFLKNGPLNKGEQQGCFSVNSMREMVLSFFSGLCIERNLKSGKASSTRKIDRLGQFPLQEVVEDRTQRLS